ncbi:MAG: hypothetical protein ACRD9R_19970, partial [Pyrinomonadaceae bacterium]
MRCIFERLIFIATIIADVIECLPGRITCEASAVRILPSGLRENIETRFIPGLNPATNGRNTATITCRVEDQFGSPVSGHVVRFNIDRNIVTDNGGHTNHTGTRPTGTLNRTSAPTDANGVATAVFTAPVFGGSTRINISDQGGGSTITTDIFAEVPNLRELPAPGPTDGYV